MIRYIEDSRQSRGATYPNHIYTNKEHLMQLLARLIEFREQLRLYNEYPDTVIRLPTNKVHKEVETILFD